MSRDLLFRIVDLLLAFGELLLHASAFWVSYSVREASSCSARTGTVPSLVQLGAGGLKLGVGGGSTGAQLELALQQLCFHAAQGGFGLGDQVRVGEVGREMSLWRTSAACGISWA